MAAQHFKNVVLHIGLHKTATTFFQEHVWTKLKTYTLLTTPYTQHNHAFNQLQYADDSLYSKSLVVDELNKIKAENLLISDENLTGKPVIFSYVNRSLVAQRLKELFPDAKILLFIRDQKDILRSYYSSYVKMLYGTKKFKDFIWKPGNNYVFEDFKNKPHQYDLKTLYYNTNDFYLHLDCFKYTSLINCFSKLFNDFHVFLYEDLVDNNRSVLNKIEDIVGEKLDVHFDNKVNVSLSSVDLEKTRQANIFSSNAANRPLRRISQWVMRMFARPPGDTQEETSELVGDYYNQDNQKLKSICPHLNWNQFPEKYC